MTLKFIPTSTKNILDDVFPFEEDLTCSTHLRGSSIYYSAVYDVYEEFLMRNPIVKKIEKEFKVSVLFEQPKSNAYNYLYLNAAIQFYTNQIFKSMTPKWRKLFEVQLNEVLNIRKLRY